MTTLFDLRDQPLLGYVAKLNERIQEELPEYVARYGLIGSDRWWDLYDAGWISRTVHVDEISHVGITKDEFDEPCDVVQIQTDRREIVYDREGFWLHPEIEAGRWVEIQQVKVVQPGENGAVTSIVDVRVTLLNNISEHNKGMQRIANKHGSR